MYVETRKKFHPIFPQFQKFTILFVVFVRTRAKYATSLLFLGKGEKAWEQGCKIWTQVHWGAMGTRSRDHLRPPLGLIFVVHVPALDISMVVSHVFIRLLLSVFLDYTYISKLLNSPAAFNESKRKALDLLHPGQATASHNNNYRSWPCVLPAVLAMEWFVWKKYREH